MASSSGVPTPLTGLALVACGAAMVLAAQQGLWGTFVGAVLMILWLILASRWSAMRPRSLATAAFSDSDAAEATLLRLLLDQAPTPLLSIEGTGAHALNRAARTLFATDDRLLPTPPALADAETTHLQHEGRHWRIDRVRAQGIEADRTVVALIDVEGEERAAEARATAELIQVLGHELLNGLAPIVSLAESGIAAAASPGKSALLPEILETLARRAEGLLRFTEGYRAMARLPTPRRVAVAPAMLAQDLATLFASRWSTSVTLDVHAPAEGLAYVDRDQMTQAIWALLQNGAEAALAANSPPRVSLDLRCDRAGLTVEIGDSGSGVPATEVNRMFRPFHTTKPGGSGIGLSLARQIARAHGGDVRLMPEDLTTFRLSIPNAGSEHL